ncbi:hypothetical protein GCM10010176_078980 [Nonomuraea spiralis]|nr:hypothetical protein GCM10010176_078980 [Nonomuraea spiralis]
MGAAAYIMSSDETVIGMGGFMGADPAPSAARLDRWVRAGELRYVLSGSGPEPLMPGGRGAAQARTAWISGTCTAVPAAEYGGTTPSGTSARSPFGGAQTLYRCGT